MAHGKNAEKNGLRREEYWSRRPIKCYGGVGRWYKTITHRAERRQADIEIRSFILEIQQ